MNVSNPIRRNDLFIEAIESHLPFSDEFILICGSCDDGTQELVKSKFCDRVKILDLEWPQGKGNWTWEQFAKHWNYGIDNCKGDWVCATESDHIFHEKDAELVRERIERLGTHKTHLLIDKLVSSTWGAWQSKTKFPLFINKGEFPSLGYGLADTPTDLAYPIYRTGFSEKWQIPTGKIVDDSTGRNIGLYMWNYDKCFKTRDQIFKERDAANWAWNNSSCVLERNQPRWEDESEGVFLSRMKSRYENSPYQFKIKTYHPKVMQDRLASISPNALGFDLFGTV